MSNRIELNDIYAATNGGRTIIQDIVPNSIDGFESNGRKKFRMRSQDEDPTPSASVKCVNGVWKIHDFGGTEKPMNAIDLVMQEKNLSFIEALNYLAEKYAPHLIPADGSRRKTISPDLEKAPSPIDNRIVNYRKKDTFTKSELKLLGYKIEDHHAKDLYLYPIDSYVTSRNEKGDSWIISANENYPMYAYDYNTWGKIYQPLGETRFMYYGEKPEFHLFSDKTTAKLYADALKGIYPDVEQNEGIDERKEALILCSGGTDALNVYASGFNVAWLNSETEELPIKVYNHLKKCFKNIYILYDIDATGQYHCFRIALQFLDLKIINLPPDLGTFRTYKGKPCKDAKDYFLHYRKHNIKSIRQHFGQLVKTAESLCFWDIKQNQKGEFTGYDINNQRLYYFLEANGFCKLDIPSGKRNFSYAHIQNNIVKLIDEEDLQVYVNNYLVQWVKENPYHYHIQLINSIHRSNQVKLASLERMAFRQLDMKSFDSDHDFMFFQNTAVKITAEGLSEMKLEKVGKFVLDENIIKHYYRPHKPLFKIEFSDKFNTLFEAVNNATPGTPEYTFAKQQLDGLRDIDTFKLVIDRVKLQQNKLFSTMQYMYNTGRVHWRKEEAKRELTDEEQKEHDHHFINKVVALGYQIYRFKEKSLAWFVYCMETEMSEVGKHLGGTGKSMYLELIKYVRHQTFCDGQGTGMQDDDKVFGGIDPGRTEHFFIDDLSDKIDLHRIMPKVTADMEVKKLYRDKVVIPFTDSPKVAITSNHSIKSFDNSLKRRTLFAAFCDYYHAEDKQKSMSERNPYTEFGKNIPVDYDEDEMNTFFNFMMQCLHAYLSIRRKVQPPMAAIERRTIQREIGDEFIWWADDYLADKFDTEVNKEEAFESYKQTMPQKYRDSIKSQTFKNRIIQYCNYISNHETEYIFNPSDMLVTKTEQKRNDIRRTINGEDVYYFYIQSKNLSVPAPPQLKTKGNDVDGGTAASQNITNYEPPF